MNAEAEKDGECDVCSKVDRILYSLICEMKNGNSSLSEAIFIFETNESKDVIDENLWRKIPDSYFKRATAWLKYLRKQLSNRDFSNLVILSTRLVNFLKLNLIILRNYNNEFIDKPTLAGYFLFHLTWFLTEMSTTPDK